jgi:hypothetical protein
VYAFSAGRSIWYRIMLCRLELLGVRSTASSDCAPDGSGTSASASGGAMHSCGHARSAWIRCLARCMFDQHHSLPLDDSVQKAWWLDVHASTAP